MTWVMLRRNAVWEWSQGNHESAIAALEPILIHASLEDPEARELVAWLVLMLAWTGDSEKALAVASRLPLKKRHLSDELLLGLAARGVAHATSGRTSRAKSDADRLYSLDPSSKYRQLVQDALEGRFTSNKGRPLTELTPEEFEHLVARVFEARGYTATVTQFVGDGGVDITLKKNGRTEVVQCKRYKGQVPVAAVRELFGAMSDFNAVHGHFVTSGRFTNGGYEFASGKPLSLVSGDDLAAMLQHSGLSTQSLSSRSLPELPISSADRRHIQEQLDREQRKRVREAAREKRRQDMERARREFEALPLDEQRRQTRRSMLIALAVLAVVVVALLVSCGAMNPT